MGKKTRRRFSSKDKAKAVRSHLIDNKKFPMLLTKWVFILTSITNGKATFLKMPIQLLLRLPMPMRKSFLLELPNWKLN